MSVIYFVLGCLFMIALDEFVTWRRKKNYPTISVPTLYTTPPTAQGISYTTSTNVIGGAKIHTMQDDIRQRGTVIKKDPVEDVKDKFFSSVPEASEAVYIPEDETKL